MNQATKLLLLSGTLVLLAVVISKLQGPGTTADPTASLRDRRAPSSLPTIPSRLSGQPQILRAKQESGLDSSPSTWHLEDHRAAPEAAVPMPVPVFPTGQPLVPSAWLSESPGTESGRSSPSEREHFRPVTPPALDPVPVVTAWPPIVAAEPAPPLDYVLTESQDSFWRISERVYGTGKYYKALYQHNRRAVLRPDQLEAGIQILTPPLDELRAMYPQLCPDGVPVESPRGA